MDLTDKQHTSKFVQSANDDNILMWQTDGIDGRLFFLALNCNVLSITRSYSVYGLTVVLPTVQNRQIAFQPPTC